MKQNSLNLKKQRYIHSLSPEIIKGISKHEIFQSALVPSENKETSTIMKSTLEKHINEVAKKIDVHLEMHEITPAVGNCWYEACSSLMKLNKM